MTTWLAFVILIAGASAFTASMVYLAVFLKYRAALSGLFQWTEQDQIESDIRVADVFLEEAQRAGNPKGTVAILNEMVRRYGDRQEPALAERVAAALVNKGVWLGDMDRFEEAVAVCDEVVRRYGDRQEPALAERVAAALVNKGVTLGQMDRSEEAVAVYDEVVGRFGGRAESLISEIVAMAKDLIESSQGESDSRGKRRRIGQQQLAAKLEVPTVSKLISFPREPVEFTAERPSRPEEATASA